MEYVEIAESEFLAVEQREKTMDAEFLKLTDSRTIISRTVLKNTQCVASVGQVCVFDENKQLLHRILLRRANASSATRVDERTTLAEIALGPNASELQIVPKDAVFISGCAFVLLQAGEILEVSAADLSLRTLDPLGLGPARRTADEFQVHPERLFVRGRVLGALFVKTDPKKLQAQSTLVFDVCELAESDSPAPAWEGAPAKGDRMCWKCEKVVVGSLGVSAFCECGGWFE